MENSHQSWLQCTTGDGGKVEPHADTFIKLTQKKNKFSVGILVRWINKDISHKTFNSQCRLQEFIAICYYYYINNNIVHLLPWKWISVADLVHIPIIIACIWIIIAMLLYKSSYVEHTCKICKCLQRFSIWCSQYGHLSSTSSSESRKLLDQQLQQTTTTTTKQVFQDASIHG